MSSSDRRSFVFICGAAGLSALSGCGFSPVYGPQGRAEGLPGEISVDSPRDPQGFALVRALEARLGLPDAPVYQLGASISLSESRLGITAGEEFTRFNVIGRVSFTLREIGSGRIVTRGEVENFASYSTAGTAFASDAARRDAEERLMVILADQVVTRLLVTVEDWRG